MENAESKVPFSSFEEKKVEAPVTLPLFTTATIFFI
jgi:hypothetical protein